jgi:hypothetical protein
MPRDRVEKPGTIIGRIYGYLGVDPAALMAKTRQITGHD